MSKDDFASSVNTMSVFSESDLAPKYPSNPSTSSDASGIKKNKYTAKYGRFILDEHGSPELEAIMNDVLAGKKMLCEEKWYSTSEGQNLIVIKYLIPEALPQTKDPNVITMAGLRRQRKALIKKEGVK